MSKFELNFYLKQHTPLIHFQHNQAGATLRATELKPKLDKFIIEKLGKDNIPREWYIDKEREEESNGNEGKKRKRALDYKVKIEGKEIELNTISKDDKITLFFGNMGEDYNNNPKAFSFSEESISVKIHCYNSNLRNKIKEIFPFFIASTNFGTRQNKGFGSFFLDLNKHNEIDLDEIFNGVKYLKINDNSQQAIRNVINYYYQRLKSGINYSFPRTNFCHYKHSFLKLYLSQKFSYTWEKRWLKEKFISLPPNSVNKKFARAMLGLVGSYSFIPKRNNNCNNNNEGDYIFPNIRINIDVSSNEIERFKSPITFKPIIINDEVRIYILIDKVPTELSDKEFEFSTNSKREFLSTPSSVIDIQDLIDEYHKHLGSRFTAYTFTENPKYNVEIL